MNHPKRPLHADYAFIKAERGDRWGNLTYRKTARNFGPIMAMAARCAIATVHELVPLGGLDPEAVVTPREATGAGGVDGGGAGSQRSAA